MQLQEQRRLLQLAENALKLAKPCAPSKAWRQQQRTDLKQCWQVLALLESRWQGSKSFPAATFSYHSPATTAVIVHECATCTACGASTARLKLCSACKVRFGWRQEQAGIMQHGSAGPLCCADRHWVAVGPAG